MDRQTEYVGALVREVDGLQAQQNVMEALGWEAQGFLGTATAVDGFTCTPTTPSASLNVLLTAGQIYQLEPLEASPWSSLPINTAQSIVKQGLMTVVDSIALVPPGTIGFSQVFLIEVQYQDLDTNPVLLPYYNVANPASPFSGPGNNGQSQNTARLGIVAVQVKAGTAATTGTQVTPTQDAGWTGIFAVTLAFGQSTITSGNIATVNTAPWVPTKLPAIPPGVLNGTWVFCQDTGAVNAYVGGVSFPGFVPTTLLVGMQVRLKIAHTNTGASTFNFSGLGTASIVRADGSATQANDLQVNAVIDLTYDGTHWQITNFYGVLSGGSTTQNFVTGLPYVVDSGTVNNIVASFSPAITGGSYVAGLAVLVKLSNTVTGPTKITVNANAQTNVIMPDGSVIQSGDLKSGMVLMLVLDGTNFQVASWQDAVSPLRVLEATGSGQSIPGGVSTLITCFTSINRNTLVTSSWSGGTFTVGAGEDGLWFVFVFAEFTIQTRPWAFFYNLNIKRTRAIGGVQETFEPCGSAIPQPGTSIILDLQVGDTVQIIAGNQVTDSITTSPTNGPNVMFYRIEGLH